MDKWLKKMNPELAVVMWGTNDTYRGPHPPKYTQNLSEIIQKILDNGTVPILYTIPPVGDQTNNPAKTKLVEGFVQAARDVAKEKQVPLVDFYAQIMARQPVNFAKTLMGDNLHPSYPPQYANDFSPRAWPTAATRCGITSPSRRCGRSTRRCSRPQRRPGQWRLIGPGRGRCTRTGRPS
jgi:hypothetical protein